MVFVVYQELVTVTSAMDMKAFAEVLKKHLKKNVQKFRRKRMMAVKMGRVVVTRERAMWRRWSDCKKVVR